MRLVRSTFFRIGDIIMEPLSTSTWSLLAIGIGQPTKNRVQPVDHGQQRITTEFTTATHARR